MSVNKKLLFTRRRSQVSVYRNTKDAYVEANRTEKTVERVTGTFPF